MAKKSACFDLDSLGFSYFDILSNVFGGTIFFVLYLLAKGNLGEIILFLTTGEFNEFISVVIAIPIVYVVGMLLHSISTVVSWMFENLLDDYSNSRIVRVSSTFFTFHLLFGQTIRSIYNDNNNNCGTKLSEKYKDIRNHTGGLSNFYARASLMEGVLFGSCINIGVYFYFHGWSFSYELLILIAIMFMSYVQSIFYWKRFVRSKWRRIEKGKTEAK